MLLERGDVHPNQLDTKDSRTPLSWEAQNGNEGIFRMLLEGEDVNPNQPDTMHGRTPLSRAAANEQQGVALER